MKTMKAMKINAKKAMKAKFKAMKAMKAKPKANIASKAPSFQIFIEVGLGKTITVVVKGADTVDQLKAKIQDNLKNVKFKEGSSSSNLVVRLDQPWMGRTLADYGLKKNSIVTLAREFTTNEEEKVGQEYHMFQKEVKKKVGKEFNEKEIVEKACSDILHDDERLERKAHNERAAKLRENLDAEARAPDHISGLSGPHHDFKAPGAP